MRHEQTFDQLINPGVPIPPGATAVHRIEHVMTGAARILPPSTTLAEAVRLMVDEKRRALLAGDAEAGRADGIVTQCDVLRAIARLGPAALDARWSR